MYYCRECGELNSEEIDCYCFRRKIDVKLYTREETEKLPVGDYIIEEFRVIEVREKEVRLVTKYKVTEVDSDSRTS